MVPPGSRRDITESKQAQEALRRLERRVAYTGRILGIFLTVPDDEVYASVLPVLLEATGSKYGVCGYIDGDGALVVPSMTRHIWDQCQVPEKDIVFPRAEWGDSIWPRAIREKRTLYSNERSALTPAGHVSITRNITVPIVHQGEAIGILAVANKETDYDEQDVGILQAIGDHVAPILSARLQRDRQETARREAEEAVRRHARDLGERVKELRCLYGISELVTKPGLALDEVLQRVADLIPPAFLHPQETCARISLEGREFRTPGFRETEWQLTRDIVGHGGPVGAVEVYYLEEKPKADEGLWLGEEKDLIGAIAERLGHTIERARAEEALAASEARLRTLLDSLLQKVFRKDRDSVYVYANRRYADGLRISPEEIVGKTDYDFYPHELAERYRRDDRRVMDSGEVEEFDESYVQDGQERTVHTARVPVRDEQGNVHGILGTFWDVTEQRQLERQVLATSRLETIGTLAGGVAHDFNNILTGIIGYADILRTEGWVSDEGAQELQGIRDLGDRAADLTRQLLAFSRQQRIEPVVVNVNDVVGNLTKMLGRLVGEDIALAFRLAPDLRNCRADPGQIEQVLMNLVANAGQAMPREGKLTVETANVVLDEAYASRHLGVTPGPCVMMAISDTGCGMDEATQARVFEPFFTTKEVGQGTGLGLATVYGIVKQHGGNIWVYSEPGRGTTFKVYLPAVELEAEHPAAVAEKPAPAGQETVLVVEDNEAVLGIARRTLAKQGYTVLPAADPVEAEETFARHEGEISLLLTDVVMPQMAGPDLYSRLVARRPSLKVLYMSGYTAHAALQNGILSGGLPFLQKPFDRDALLRRVREVLDS